MLVALDEPQQQVQICLEVMAAKEDLRQGRKSLSWTWIWGNWKSMRSCSHGFLEEVMLELQVLMRAWFGQDARNTLLGHAWIVAQIVNAQREIDKWLRQSPECAVHCWVCRIDNRNGELGGWALTVSSRKCWLMFWGPQVQLQWEGVSMRVKPRWLTWQDWVAEILVEVSREPACCAKQQ